MLKLVLMLRSKKVDGLRAITSNYKGEPKLKLIFLVYFLWVITKTHFTATFLLHFMNHLKVNESRHKYCGVTHPLPPGKIYQIKYWEKINIVITN